MAIFSCYKAQFYLHTIHACQPSHISLEKIVLLKHLPQNIGLTPNDISLHIDLGNFANPHPNFGVPYTSQIPELQYDF